MPDLGQRLLRFTQAPQASPFRRPESPGAWLEYAYQQAYAEDMSGARTSVEAGLRMDPGEEMSLALLAAAITFELQLGAPAAAAEYLGRRIALLRRTGQETLADIEEELGTAYFGPVTEQGAAALRDLAERHNRKETPPTILADLRLPLAIWDMEQGAPPQLHVLRACVQVYRNAGKYRSLVDALLSLAPALSAVGELPESLCATEELLELCKSPNLRGMALLIKATTLRAIGRHFPALDAAFEALELFNEVGIRRGAISAAVLLAELSSDGFDHEAATLAWGIAIAQGERGEISELWALRLSLAEHLLAIGDHQQAAELLESLTNDVEHVRSPLDRGRILQVHGNALYARERHGSALEAWLDAAELYAANGGEANAASILLVAGQLAPGREAPLDAASLFARSVDLAFAALDPDGAVLAHALLARGGELASRGIASGIADIDSAMLLARTAGNAEFVATFRSALAEAHGALGNTGLGISTALEAADELRTLGLHGPSARAELIAADLLIADGRVQEAVGLYRILSEDAALELEVLHEVLQLLGHALSLQGHTHESEAAYDRAAAALRLPEG